jgi:hypothetical protein
MKVGDLVRPKFGNHHIRRVGIVLGRVELFS